MYSNLPFEPTGLTDDPDVRMAQSVMHYIFRRLALDYLPFDERAALGIYTAAEREHQLETGMYEEIIEADTDSELESFAQSAATTPAPEQVRSDKPEASDANAGGGGRKSGV